jgi:hypothetical protein
MPGPIDRLKAAARRLIDQDRAAGQRYFAEHPPDQATAAKMAVANAKKTAGPRPPTAEELAQEERDKLEFMKGGTGVSYDFKNQDDLARAAKENEAMQARVLQDRIAQDQAMRDQAKLDWLARQDAARAQKGDMGDLLNKFQGTPADTGNLALARSFKADNAARQASETREQALARADKEQQSKVDHAVSRDSGRKSIAPITNAMKYTPAGLLARYMSGQVTQKIGDQGEQADAETLKHVRQPQSFQRNTEDQQSYEGKKLREQEALRKSLEKK